MGGSNDRIVNRRRGRVATAIAIAGLVACSAGVARAQQLTLARDTTLDSAAFLMPATAQYGRSINGVSFQDSALMTRGKYQYATWYHNGASDEDLYLARRDLSTNGAWQVMDTGKNFDNGDSTGAWDAHNVTSVGIDGNGRISLAWDVHQHNLRYMTTADGAATGATWTSAIFGAETKTLPGSGVASAATPFNEVTYPQFVTKANGDMLMAFRNHNSGNGDMYLATYNATSKTWGAPHNFLDGTHNALSYDDNAGSPSTTRSAYINGLNVDPKTGRIHTTWTWREGGTPNHDILYAYSDDNGDTWRNNGGAVVGTLANPINLNSPGIVIKTLDRSNTLINQQAQALDGKGKLHAVMWHLADGKPAANGFTTTNAAYYDYFQDANGTWQRTALPTDRAVGSRPDIAFDKNDTLYAAYVSPGPGDGATAVQNYYTDGDLIVARATAAGGYNDWQIVYTDATRNWASEPRIDQQRLLNDGVLSIFEQDGSTVTTATGSALHVLEFNVAVPEPTTAGVVALVASGALTRRRRRAR